MDIQDINVRVRELSRLKLEQENLCRSIAWDCRVPADVKEEYRVIFDKVSLILEDEIVRLVDMKSKLIDCRKSTDPTCPCYGSVIGSMLNI